MLQWAAGLGQICLAFVRSSPVKSPTTASLSTRTQVLDSVELFRFHRVETAKSHRTLHAGWPPSETNDPTNSLEFYRVRHRLSPLGLWRTGGNMKGKRKGLISQTEELLASGQHGGMRTSFFGSQGAHRRAGPVRRGRTPGDLTPEKSLAFAGWKIKEGVGGFCFPWWWSDGFSLGQGRNHGEVRAKETWARLVHAPIGSFYMAVRKLNNNTNHN